MDDRKNRLIRGLTCVVLIAVAMTPNAAGATTSPRQAAPLGSGSECTKRDKNGICVYEEEQQDDADPQKPPRERDLKPGDTYTETGYGDICTGGNPDSQTGGVCSATTCEDGGSRVTIWERVNTYTGRGQWSHGPWENTGRTVCLEADDEQVTSRQIQRAVERFGLRPGRLGTSPPNGKTLVGLETIFYSTNQQYSFTLDLGPGVQIRATPVQYKWDYGDGSGYASPVPGRPYPNFDIVHTYEQTGTFDVTLTIEYKIEWNAGAGWAQLTDTIPSQPGTPHTLQVLETRTALRGPKGPDQPA